MNNRYANELLSLLVEKQVPMLLALRNTGLQWEKLQAGEQEVRTGQMATLIENARKLVEQGDLGLQFGRRLNANTHGILGYTLMSCDNLHEMLLVWLKYYKLNYANLDLHLDVSDRCTFLTVRILSTDDSHNIFAKEALFASMHVTASFLLNDVLSGTEIWFDYPEPYYKSSYDSVFKAVTRFNMPSCQLRIPTDLLEKRLSSANPEAALIHKQQCANMLRTMKQHQGLARRVQVVLLEHNNGGFPRIVDVAKQLHLSERTLRRKLDAESTSFQEVLNDVRFDISTEYLTSTKLPVADIADLLGFADPSNFRRAFIQWSSLSPAEYRRKNWNASSSPLRVR